MFNLERKLGLIEDIIDPIIGFDILTYTFC